MGSVSGVSETATGHSSGTCGHRGEGQRTPRAVKDVLRPGFYEMEHCRVQRGGLRISDRHFNSVSPASVLSRDGGA